jgi:hypothetical protein
MGSGSSKAAAEKAAAKKAAAEKGSDRHLWQAVFDHNEAELRRLIGLGWSVNWHNPDVRRRMCLAWASASTRRHLPHSPAARRARRTPACSPIRLTPLALEDGWCVRPVLRIHSSDDCLNRRARRVRPTPPRVRGDRQRHGGKPRACLLPSTMPWVSFHVVISLLSSLLSSEPRMVSSALGGIQRPPRDRQASPRRRRRSDASNQVGRDGHRFGTGAFQERGRGPAERASVRGWRPNRMRIECELNANRMRNR